MREVFLNSDSDRVYVSIVHFNSATTHSPLIIKKSLESVLNQKGYTLGKNLFLRICDNGSTDQTWDVLQDLVAGKDIYLYRNRENLGFSAAHNQSVYKFLNSNCNYLLVFNPDVSLDSNALEMMVQSFSRHPKVGLVGPKLLRGDEFLEPVEPSTLDSTGMILTPNLRHLDRGSNTLDQGQYDREELVFGLTGACLLIKKSMVHRLLLPVNNYQNQLYKIYPALQETINERYELFDESFFAYREDADLCWRANNLGIQSLYLPEAIGIHRRVVLATNRQQVSPKLNYLSVRNRFLLQINNYSFWKNPKAFFPGIIFRNLIVVMATILIERASLPAFSDLKCLFLRAWKNRQHLLNKLANG